MNGNGRFERRDWMIAVLFVVVSFALRVPFRSEYAYHWDGAQFALAIENFDMLAGLPHPPGFFLYVMCGRLVNVVVGDPHASLVWMSVVAGAVLTGLGYLLGTAVFGRVCGWLSGVMLATSMVTWFHSEIALTTIVDGALVTGTALVCWRVIQSGGGWWSAGALGALLAVVGGVRGQTVPALLPLWLYTFWRMREGRWGKLAVGCAVLAVVGLLWFVPLVESVGGLGMYRELLATKTRYDAPHRLVGGGFDAVAENLAMIAATTGLGLLLGGLLAVMEFVRFVLFEHRTERAAVYARQREALRFMTLWIVPMFLSGSVFFYTYMPGYVLSYFPAVVILVALGVQCVGERLRVGWVALAVAIAGVNAWVFLRDPVWLRKSWPRLEMTAPEVRLHDRQLAGWFREIRNHYRPGEVAICHWNQWFLFGIRHFGYHLPEYENWLLSPDQGLVGDWGVQRWRMLNRRVEFMGNQGLPITQRVVLMVPPGAEIERFAEYFDLREVRRLDGPQGSLFELRQASSKE